MAENYQTIGNRLIEQIKAHFGQGGLFTAYFEGDPMQIPIASLPAVAVDTTDGEFTAGPTGFDRLKETIVIKLILNKRDDYGASDTVDMTTKKLYDMIYARDATTKQYLDTSLMGAIRTKFTLDNAVIDQNIRVEFGIQPRAAGLVTSEAHVTITTNELVPVPIRT